MFENREGSRMARFFFHVKNDSTFKEEEGENYPNLETARCPYRKPHPASEQTANRVMFVPDDRFSHVAGMRADQALPIEGTA